jgi:hypothetical protein
VRRQVKQERRGERGMMEMLTPWSISGSREGSMRAGRWPIIEVAAEGAKHEEGRVAKEMGCKQGGGSKKRKGDGKKAVVPCF